MPKIISIFNQKGGVAKTTSVINLGACLSELGKKVLLIDMDPQSSLTTGLGIDNISNSIYDSLVDDEIPLKNIIHETKFNLDVIPSNMNLANAELELSNVISKETILKYLFEDFKEKKDYDYILLDCNPSIGVLPINALTASDSIIIPVEAGIFAMEGIKQLIKVYQLIRKKLNNNLDIEGILLTKVDQRTKIAKQCYGHLQLAFKEKVFKTIIHGNIKIAEAQAECMPINFYDRKSKGYYEYMNLAKELIENG